MHKQRQRETVMTGTHRQEDTQAMTVSTCPSDKCTSQAICLVLASSSMEKNTQKKPAFVSQGKVRRESLNIANFLFPLHFFAVKFLK